RGVSRARGGRQRVSLWKSASAGSRAGRPRLVAPAVERIKINRDGARLGVCNLFPSLGGQSMSRIVRGLLVLALAVPALAAAGQSKEKSAAPARQYQA